MKKILLLVLAVCMLMCTNVTAYAASATPNEELCNTVVATYENIGIIPTQNNAPKFAHKEYDTQEVLDYLQASQRLIHMELRCKILLNLFRRKS